MNVLQTVSATVSRAPLSSAEVKPMRGHRGHRGHRRQGHHIAGNRIGPHALLFPARGHRTGPISLVTYTRVWRLAREDAFPPAQQRSPLAKVPYQLRHAAVSLWLNAGVPATQVAEWAGHSVHVLLKVYAKCIDGQDEAARQRIERALGDDEGSAAE